MRRQGMTVATVPGTGHTVFRDDHAGFMHAVVDWLRGHAGRLPCDGRAREPPRLGDARSARQDA